MSIINVVKSKDTTLIILYANCSDFEHSCKLSAFIKSLDINQHIEPVNIDSYLSSVNEDQKDTVRSIYSELISLYSSIGKQEENIKSYCCFYLNYWLDKKKKDYITEKCIDDDAWQVIEKLWGTLKNPSVSCKRQHYYEPSVDKEKCVDLMVYCVNRDELRQICEQDDEEGLKKNYCDNFNKYTNHYYTHFTKNVTCLSDTNNDIHPNWKFSDTCTLHDMAKTFPKYETSSQTIVDDGTREKIRKCESHEDSRPINCYMLDGVPVTLEELSATINVIPLKYGIYAGSSFIGFISLGLYLYKKTRNTSLVRSNSREKKINNNTDKQHSHEQEKKSDSKNKDYKFSYNPIQN